MSAFDNSIDGTKGSAVETFAVAVVDERNLPNVLELRKLLPADVNTAFTDHECERFLIARKFDLIKAADQLVKRALWYTTPFNGWKISHPELRPCDLLTYVDEKEPMFAKYGFNSHIGHDLDGDPIYWEKSGLATSKWNELMKTFTADESVARHIQQMEITMERLRRTRLQSGRLNTRLTVVMDMKDLPILPDFSSIAVVRRVMEIDESMYPEILKRVLMINVPGYAQVIFNLITPFIDPVTQTKYKVGGSNFFSLLSEHIAPDQIPVEYGGTCVDFSWNFPNNIINVMREVSNNKME